MEWTPYCGQDSAEELATWIIPALHGLSEAVERGAVAMIWATSEHNRGTHRLLWQLAGTGQLQSREEHSLLWPGTLIAMAGDANEVATLDSHQSSGQQLELRAINDDLACILHRYDEQADSVWHDQYRFPAGIGKRWQQLLDTALSCGSGESSAEIGLPLIVAACRLAAKAATVPARPHRGRRLRQHQIEKMVLNHFFEPDCNADTIAAALQLSKSHIQRIFKQHSGESLHTFILRLRVRRADQLLASHDADDLAQHDLALRCGFSDEAELVRGRRLLKSV